MTETRESAASLSQARFDPAALSEILNAIFHAPVESVRCTPIQGDASDRKYFRLSFRLDGGGPRSLILMQLAEPALQEDNDFTRTLKFLKTLELPVPGLYHHDRGKGLLYLEDCGTATLEDRLSSHPEETESLYRQAVELLARMHHRATQAIGPDCPAHSLRFDVEKLMWEFDFMLTHYVAGLKCKPLTAQSGESVRQPFRSLCETLAAEELCFTHRDYHCRNLMADGKELFILDFQDARMGPCQYDLASLLKDSYFDLTPALRAALVEHYIGLRERQTGRTIDRARFEKIFDWMSVQRNLKAVGTFAYQQAVRGNGRYLDYIPRTLAYVKETLERRPDLADLRAALFAAVPDLETA